VFFVTIPLFGQEGGFLFRLGVEQQQEAGAAQKQEEEAVSELQRKSEEYFQSSLVPVITLEKRLYPPV